MPVVVPVDDVPGRPDPALAGSLCGIVAEVLAELEPEGSAVLALARPGPAAPGETDRYWNAVLRDAALERGAAIRMVCLAAPGGVCQLAPDEPAAPDPARR